MPYVCKVDNTGIESDSFKRSDSSINWIKNRDNFLVMDNEGNLLFKGLPKQQQSEYGCKFSVQFYNANEPCKGKAVTLFTTKDSSKKVVCCSETGEICAETLDVPGEIGDGGHKALFFLKTVKGSSATFRVESSVRRSHVLGFEADANNPYMKRLVLRLYNEREVDVDCHMQVLRC
uniref:interleukin-18-like n=1 Tax=Centroberyx gerrardi TaxID=166262 RepID=UPI003AB035BD